MSDRPAVRYRPGWTFAWDTADGLPHLLATVEQADAYTGAPRVVTFGRDFPDPFDPQRLLRFISGIEDHETREWLRVNGELVDDPHGPCDGVVHDEGVGGYCGGVSGWHANGCPNGRN